MKCEQVLSLLSRFQDNECDPQTASGIHLHLQKCDHCRQEFDQMSQTIAKLKTIKDVEPAANFTATVMKNLPAQQSFHLIPAPSLIYSAVFIIFFTLGIFLTLPLKTDKKTENTEVTLVQLLIESQNRNHFSAQYKTIELIHSGDKHEK
jgi:hypothetical protein